MARKIPLAQAMSGDEIERIASGLIERFSPESLTTPGPFDVETFFECELESVSGVRSDYVELQTGIPGLTDVGTMVAAIDVTLAEDRSSHGRKFRRSTIAHECGHAVLHVRQFRDRKEALRFIHHTDEVSLRLYREQDVPAYQNPEWQAWRFAHALLMPIPTVRKAVKLYPHVVDIAEIFDVNPAFARVRLNKLGLLK